jgi:cell division protease FtsH
MKDWLAKLGAKWNSVGRARRGVALAVGLLAVTLAGSALAFLPAAQAPAESVITYTRLSQLAGASPPRASAVRVDGERFVVTVDGALEVAVVADADSRHALIDKFAAAHVPLSFEGQEQSGWQRTLGTGAPMLVFAVFGLAFLAMHQRKSKAHFKEHRQGSEATVVRFADVAGMDEVKESLRETVEFLRDPKRFGRLGGRAPRGVLLTGQPGTGKTLLARAVATEAGVPFLSASGSSFQEMFVGIGASRVRKLFAEARRLAPCIVFIDEIDAVGRARGKGSDSASADHDQTLNQLLVEMDGFDHKTGIVVIASTNRADILDPAVLRPGRFDRQVVVPLPDLRGRKEILQVHARPVALGPTVDLSSVARGTPGFSGADLANLVNEAAILAARDGADTVEFLHLERARDRVLMGDERRGFLMDADERYATAVHEAGHVAVVVAAPHSDPVHKVSILPRGRALGVTQSLPERDRLMYKKEYLEDQICMLMGGRAAEKIILGTMTAGAADDIKRAAAIAHKMVAEFGMSELGCIHLCDDGQARSQTLLDRIEEEARAIVDFQLARACKIVEDRRAEMKHLVDQLLEADTLDAAQIRACFASDAAKKPLAVH